MICSGCGGPLTNSQEPNPHWCQVCSARELEHREAVDRAKLRVHRILRAMRDRPILLEALNTLMKPQTMADAVTYLLCTMPEADLAKVKAEDRDNLIMYHQGFGRSLRNRFRLHYETKLVQDCCQGREELHADEASLAIIEALWEAVQTMELPEAAAG